MKLLLMNQDWFREEFEAAGHQVLSIGFMRHFEVKLKDPLLHLDSVLSLLPNNFAPDAIVVYDESSPILIRGIEETSIPTLFYSVDTHHHWFFHRYLAHIFDQTLIAQKDYKHHFSETGLDVGWMPLWASKDAAPSDEKKWEACFVGNMDAKLNPQRVEFFEALKKEVPLHVTLGQWWDIFPHSEIIVNQTVKGDLNFRVFEAMITGSLLLTERSPNGLFELFEEGTHLVTYEKHNVKEAAARINEYLADKEKCRRIGMKGREEILRNHLPRHRASFILGEIEKLEKKTHPYRNFGAMVNFSSIAAKLEVIDPGLSTRAALVALESAERGVKAGEKMSSDLACYLVRSALIYDRTMNSRAGMDLVVLCSQVYTDAPIFSLVRIRDCLNRGETQNAHDLAGCFESVDHSHIFAMAEEVVSSILSAKSNM